MRKNLCFALLFIGYVFLACDPVETNSDEIAPNNTAVLIGEEIASGESSNSVLTKTGTFTINSSTTEFEFGNLYISRGWVGSSYVNWTLPVKNISGNSHIFIKITGINYMNSSNQVIYHSDIDYTYVSGCCGHSSSNLYSTTFLRAGELGYFSGIDLIDYDQFTKLSFDAIEYSSSEFVPASIEVIPQSYHMTGSNIFVEIKNQSNQNAYITASRCFLLDQYANPVHWTFVNVPSTYTNFEMMLTGGSSGELTSSISYSGSCQKIQPYIEFDIASNSKKSEFTGPLTEANFVQMQQDRDVRLNQLEKAFK